MRAALAFLVLMIAAPAWGQTAAPLRERYQASTVAGVVTAALLFITPRALDAVSVPQLALWGLRAVTTLDPALTAELRDGTLVLLRGEQVLFQRAAVQDVPAAQWGTAIADLIGAAWAASPSVRQAGTQGCITSFFEELFNHLDPYSRYMPPDAAEADRARRSGEAGPGLQVNRRGTAFVVTGLNQDGPAAEAGIRVGDRIEAVDDQPVRGETLDTVLDMLSGIEGTEMTLMVRGRDGQARLVDLERAVVPPETVFASRSGDLLLIRITGFSRDTDQRLARELQRFLSGPQTRTIRGVVLDLRGNRGGLLRQAVAATNMLLDTGTVATTAGRNPLASHEWQAGTGDVAEGRPLVVLVDGRSASAAEIMAAALADQGRAVVAGSSTLGKGLVQTILTLPDGGELFVSWSRVLAPQGWPIQGLGVLPQVCTSLGADNLAQQLASLAHGELRMAAALGRHRAARAPLPAAEIVEMRAACPAAEGRDVDLATARSLLARPGSYNAARLLPP